MDGKMYIHVDENRFDIYHEIYNLPYKESFSYTITRNGLQTGQYVLHDARCEIVKLCGDHGFIWFEDGIYTNVYDKVKYTLLYKTFDEYLKDVIQELATQIPELQGQTIFNIYSNDINIPKITNNKKYVEG